MLCEMIKLSEQLESDEQIERAASAAARYHVGAAGFVQRDMLEQIIAAGRDQIAVTQSLRRVLITTVAQLSAIPMAEVGAVAQEQRAALERIVTAGQVQVQRAKDLRLAIQQALAEVQNTPLEHVSGHLLSTLGEAVRRQVADLENIIGAAINEASTVEQIARLERMSAELYAHLLSTEHDRGERELTQLDLQGAEALKRVRSLEEVGQTHAMQKTHLEQAAEGSRRQIRALEDAEIQDRADIARMTKANGVADAHILALQEAAVETGDEVEVLRRESEKRDHAL